MNATANSTTTIHSSTMPAPPLHHETLRERLDVMFWQEVAQYRTSDYLEYPQQHLSSSCGDFQLDGEGIMGEQWRTRMCEWAYQCKLTYVSYLAKI